MTNLILTNSKIYEPIRTQERECKSTFETVILEWSLEIKNNKKENK